VSAEALINDVASRPSASSGPWARQPEGWPWQRPATWASWWGASGKR